MWLNSASLSSVSFLHELKENCPFPSIYLSSSSRICNRSMVGFCYILINDIFRRIQCNVNTRFNVSIKCKTKGVQVLNYKFHITIHLIKSRYHFLYFQNQSYFLCNSKWTIAEWLFTKIYNVFWPYNFERIRSIKTFF